jgi:hypothetical protein
LTEHVAVTTDYHGIIIHVCRGNACLGRHLPQIPNTEYRGEEIRYWRVLPSSRSPVREEIGHRPAHRIRARSN